MPKKVKPISKTDAERLVLLERFVDWEKFSREGELSEDFIREFQDRVYWPYIHKNQRLSEEFRKEFGENLAQR
jgi:hypothetical protein